MTPEERQLLSGLFDRIHGAANQPRDREAEALIRDAVQAQPYAPYLLAQTVIVQEQALRAANDRLQELEAQVRQTAAQPQEETSFLGSIGKSIFGGAPQGRASVPPSGQPAQWGGQQAAPQPGGPWGGQPQQQGGQWGGQPQGGPPQGQWGNQPPQQGGQWGGAAPSGGGGFLKGAMGAAAGVAGGVLLADSIRGLFGGHNNPFGIASGGFGTGAAGGGETVVNNYYDNQTPTAADDAAQDSAQDQADDDAQQDFLQDQSDDFGGDSGGGGDDSYNV